MQRINEVGQVFAGKTVTIISAGHSTADYVRETVTDDVVLINWSINLADLFPTKIVYHVTMHPECLGDNVNLLLPHVRQVTGDWAESTIPQHLSDRTLLFGTRQYEDLDDPLLSAAITDRDLVDRGIVCHVANSSHCAVHFAWQLGCRDLRIMGANGYRGLPRDRYDPRLNVPIDYQVMGSPAPVYVDSFRRFVGLFDWNSVAWLYY